MDVLLASETRPFAIAALILIGLVGIEFISALVGASLSQWVHHATDHGPDHAADHDGESYFSGALDWLNAGRVPLLILIMLALGVFAVLGFVVVAVAHAVMIPLPAFAASAIAVAAAVPVVRVGTRAVARIVPRDETYAVAPSDLVGRTAEVTMGPLDDGLPGRVKLRDAHGNWHFPRARAAKGQPPMAIGSTVLLVEWQGATFLAIPAPPDLTDR
jgi:membrane protein implicated in regulation of membrane protease activity